MSLMLVHSGFLSATVCAAAVTDWVLVTNPKAGQFQAAALSEQLVAHPDSSGLRIECYQTHPDRVQRIKEISDYISSKKPSSEKPLGVVALGGDGTINDVVKAVMYHLIPNPHELLSRNSESLTDQMLASGIRIGAVQMGGANDIGSLYGTPKHDVEAVAAYLTESRLMAMNLGLAHLVDADTLEIFSHNLAAGKMIAPIYEKTLNERGRWARLHRQLLGLWNFLVRSPVKVKWRSADGQDHERVVREVISHATIRADGMNGFPGTPQPGLGIKLFPKGIWAGVRIFQELLSRGRASLKGDPSKVLPNQKLASLDSNLQPSLDVGEGMEFSFYDRSDQPLTVPVQANGDFVGRTQRMRLHALPPFPSFMGMPDCLMDRLSQYLLEAGSTE